MHEKLQLINEAIDHHYLLHFNYNGFDRTVEPHHYGQLGQALQLQAYQTKGGTRTGGVPGWKNFEIGKMLHLSLDKHSHFATRPDHNPANSHFKVIKSIH